MYTDNKTLSVVTMNIEGIVANKLYLQKLVSENLINIGCGAFKNTG